MFNKCLRSFAYPSMVASFLAFLSPLHAMERNVLNDNDNNTTLVKMGGSSQQNCLDSEESGEEFLSTNSKEAGKVPTQVLGKSYDSLFCGYYPHSIEPYLGLGFSRKPQNEVSNTNHPAGKKMDSFDSNFLQLPLEYAYYQRSLSLSRDSLMNSLNSNFLQLNSEYRYYQPRARNVELTPADLATNGTNTRNWGTHNSVSIRLNYMF